MKINSINQNYQTPNFTGITKITCDGLYKKYPEISNEILQTLKKNPLAMDFCKKHDVQIALFANKQDFSSVSSSFYMFYKNLEKKGGFLNRLLEPFRARKEIKLYSFANEYDVEKSFIKSASDMKAKITPSIADNYATGVLDANINRRLQEELESQDAASLKKIITSKDPDKAIEKDKLNNTIKELIEK
jgi:hypothetical protein